MAVYYVKTGGSDAAAGTSDGAAWAHAPGMTGATGTAASTALLPDDSVYFNRGDTWTVADAGGSGITVNASGTSGHSITFGAYGSGALPVLDGNNAEFWAGLIYIDGQSYITVQDLELRNVQKQLFGVHGTATGITLQGCTIHDNTTTGYILIYIGWGTSAVSYVTIDGNILYNTQHNIVRVSAGSSNVTISNNTLRDFAHAGVDTNPSGGGTRVSYLTVTGNDIYHFGSNQQAGGIYLPGVTNGLVADNDVHDDYTTGDLDHTGIKISTEDLSSNTITVRNNRVWNINSANANTYALYFAATTDVNVWNNTVYASYRTMLDSSNTNLSSENNLAYACDNDNVTLPNYGSDPLFVDPTGTPPNFRLQSESAVIDQGVDVGLPYIGDAPDLGAYEWEATGSVASLVLVMLSYWWIPLIWAWTGFLMYARLRILDRWF